MPQRHAKLIEVALGQIGQDVRVDFALAKYRSRIDRDRGRAAKPQRPWLYPTGRDQRWAYRTRVSRDRVSNNRSRAESGLSPGRPQTNAICGHYSQ